MLYLIGFFLLFILLLLLIIIFVFKKSKKTSPETEERPAQKSASSLEGLINILKTEKQDKSKIDETLDTMVKDFPFPQNEKDAHDHFKYVYFYAKNPLSTAKMIVQMQKQLTQINPKYIKQIEAYQMRGVEARKK